MREKDERALWAALGKTVGVLAAIFIWFAWPLTIDRHPDGSVSVLGWVLFGVWVPLSLVVLTVLGSLIGTRKQRRRPRLSDPADSAEQQQTQQGRH